MLILGFRRPMSDSLRGDSDFCSDLRDQEVKFHCSGQLLAVDITFLTPNIAHSFAWYKTPYFSSILLTSFFLLLCSSLHKHVISNCIPCVMDADEQQQECACCRREEGCSELGVCGESG